MSAIRLIRYSLAYLAYLIISVVFLLEIIFRLLPTTSPVDLQVISDKTDILKFYPDQIGRFSLGTNFYKVVEKKTNNYGFYSSYDYFPNAKPNIAIIGDSFVEAAQIRNQDTIGEIMQSEHNNLKVYQFGVSGVSLSQYVQMLKYAKKEFSPQHYVLVIVGNDFDEALCRYNIKPGTWCFNDDFDLEFNPFFGFKGFRNLMRKSAALKYLVFQVGFNWRAMFSMIKGDEKFNLSKVIPRVGSWIDQNNSNDISQYAGNTERFKSAEIISMSKGAITAFFQELSKMDMLDKVTIIIDADREDIYKDTVTYSYFNEMREFMIDKALSFGVNYLDMDSIFRDDYKINNKIFEFSTDEHWNEHSHNILSRILFKEYSLLNK
jgi:hypothetical protein